MRDKMFTAQEVADILAVPKARVYDLARSGFLPVVRLGRQIRFDPDALGKFITDGGRTFPGVWRKEVSNSEINTLTIRRTKSNNR